MHKVLLRDIPSVDELVRDPALAEVCDKHSPALVTQAARAAVDMIRGEIVSGRRTTLSNDDINAVVIDRLNDIVTPRMRRVINATGTVLHTNLGRAMLSEQACQAVEFAGRSTVNLEMDISTGERGERDSLVEDLIKRLTGAEAACIVNNNAAAVLLTLNTLAEGKEVIVSRGELIEIGGSFRLPDVIKKSSCIMREVGTTNRTHAKDYSDAVTKDTGVFFKAHTSNYKVVGFTAQVSLTELAGLGAKHNVPVVEDLGSGSLVNLTRWGLPKEPVVSDSIAAGAGLVTFSGDKLLGGPQAGIIVGKKTLVDMVRKNPLKRALRVDKLTLAALEATLRLYLNLDTLSQTLPTLRTLVRPLTEIDAVAQAAAELLAGALGDGYIITVEDATSVVGGGTLPGYELLTKAVAITHPKRGADEIAKIFLSNNPPILGRINKDRFLLDMRTVERAQDVACNVF